MHIMKFLIFCFLIFFLFAWCTSAYSHDDKREFSLVHLDEYLRTKNDYVKQKEGRIAEIKLTIDENTSGEEKIEKYARLFDEYKSYIYDSAYVYVQRELLLANESKNRDAIASANIHLAFCYLSSGLFKEACEVMYGIDADLVSDSIAAEYYALMARLYYDMADYSVGDPVGGKYTTQGMICSYKALELQTPNSTEMGYTMGLLKMQERNFQDAIRIFENLLDSAELSDHKRAIVTSSIGYMYSNMNDRKQAEKYLLQAAVYDIKSAVKEGVALSNLSQLLFEKGDIERANRYIRSAMEDADFYNARQRKIQISSILPIIEREKLDIIEKQRNNLIVFASVVTFLCMLFIVAVFTIYFQMKKLRMARKIIEHQNENLKEINMQLLEVNEMKDEYIIESIYAKAEYLDRIVLMLKTIDNKLIARQYEGIKDFVRSSNLKKERENMYSSFDKTFLRLFPDFIVEYNKLFSHQEQLELENNKGLTPEVRIFALIRLGITESERIAKFLDYSVNTINTYKTKVKNKSIVPNEEFEDRIMKIKTIRKILVHDKK